MKVVATYLALRGPNFIEERLALFAEDGIQGDSFHQILPARAYRRPEGPEGKDGATQKKWAEFSYSNVTIYKTPDPEQFIVECDGEGWMKNPMFTQPHHYDNHFFVIFVVKNGKIKSMREFMNPMKLDYAFSEPFLPDLTM